MIIVAKPVNPKKVILAKPVNRKRVIPYQHSKQFISDFNKNKVSDDFLESCKKAGDLFGQDILIMRSKK